MSKEIRRQHFEQINAMFKPYLGDKEQREKEEKKSKRKNSQPTQELMEFDNLFVDKLKKNNQERNDHGNHKK